MFVVVWWSPAKLASAMPQRQREGTPGRTVTRMAHGRLRETRNTTAPSFTCALQGIKRGRGLER